MLHATASCLADARPKGWAGMGCRYGPRGALFLLQRIRAAGARQIFGVGLGSAPHVRGFPLASAEYFFLQREVHRVVYNVGRNRETEPIAAFRAFPL